MAGFPDVYDWICHLDPSRSQSIEYLPLNVRPLYLHADFAPNNGNVSLFISRFFESGMCLIENFPDESLQKNTLPVFLSMSARVYFKAFYRPILKLEQLDIKLGTIESAKYKQAFNSLFSVVCYSLLVHGKENASAQVSESELQKLPCHRAEDILLIIGPAATDHLLRYLSAEFIYKCLHGKIDNTGGNKLRISYCNSSLPGFWIINSYCPILSMSRTSKGQVADQIISDKRLNDALSYQQLQCILQFRHAVNVYRDFIEVRLQIDNIGCDVIRLHQPHKPIPERLEDERHFPAKISISIGPQVESNVHSVSLSKSSQNPVTDIQRGKTVEAKFDPPKSTGLKVSQATSSQTSIKSWNFEQSSVNRPHVNLEWTLYDSTTGKPVTNYKPPRLSLKSKIWSGDSYSEATRAFTAQGGVLFAGDEYGQPITWRLNKDLEGQTVTWVVKGDIYLAYFPNTYKSAHFEIANHHFCQLVQLPLVQSTLN